MWKTMERHLSASGFQTLAIDYPSRSRPLEWISDSVLEPVLDSLERGGARRVHFVTHSMGGILLRMALTRHSHANLGSAVMIAPPNQGSEIAAITSRLGYGTLLLGPNLERLSRRDVPVRARPVGDPGSAKEVTENVESTFFDSLGAARIPTGVIAGDRTWNFLNSLAIPGLDDGKVSVSSTHLPGEADWTLVHANHTFISSSPEALELTSRFLTKGSFRRSPAPDGSEVVDRNPPSAGPPGGASNRTRRKASPPKG